MAGDDLQLMMDGLFWHGIPTLFRAPFDADPANAAVAGCRPVSIGGDHSITGGNL